MSVSFGDDLEAGLVSEQTELGGACMPDDDTGCYPGIGNPESIDAADHGFGDTSEKTWDLYPTRPVQHVDVVLERWKGDTESILLFTALFSATISLFVIESYNMSLSPDVADHAVALFNQVTLLDRPPPPALLPLGLDSVLLERSSTGVRATKIWFLSLGLNIACVVWVLLWQNWQQCIDLSGQNGEPHTPARLRRDLLPGIGTRFGKAHIKVEANWVLLRTSIILFLVGLVDFLLLINKTIAWILLGYLTPFAFLYAVATLLQYHFPKSLNLTLFPD